MQRTCSVEGCGRPHRARDYCIGHLRRIQRTGDAHAHIPLAEQRSCGPRLSIEPMPCRISQEDHRAAAARMIYATDASVPGRTWTHSAAYLADHAEHAAWMTTPQPDLTETVVLELAAD